MPGITKLRYTHEAMIDMLIAEPSISQGELASRFGFTPPWVSTVINSDAFQEALAKRKEELVDPVLRITIEERMRAATQGALELLLERIAMKTLDDKALIDVAKVGSRALGYGIRQPDQTTTVNQYVALLPTRERSSDDWAARNLPAQPAPVTIENGST